MNIVNAFLFTCACVGLQIEAVAGTIDKPVTMQFGEQVTLQSTILKENRNIIVHLPSGYKKSKQRYPVLYLLDGERHLYHSVIATELLHKAGQIPELIIVAVTNNEGMRQKNLNTHSEKFTLFLTNEVMTHVDKHYRTVGKNTLFGHSLAGFYTVNLLANTAVNFENYIAASPPLQGDDIDLYNKIIAPTNDDKMRNKTLYLTLATHKEEGEDVANAMHNFVKLLAESSPQGFDWHYTPLKGDTHITTSYLTLFYGIRYVFKD
ncbi:alpha/beta hydrolase [Pseudoalteromonas sp. MMG012]|uniref:alpha/beta hydrolase n=1 Tax=Pseudoalteromonas sp. MMG012 TaxID=2822686 RepID=UPI001B3A561D|nr:alpha/beta hydrolase-fold protein [Pseudoalteromonas sp. MMG012]MBQ4852994.1 hypothetical protein [Pseudoalteromonas sp. MMG012]